MGLSDAEARATLRFSLGWSTTGDEIEEALRSDPAAREEGAGSNPRLRPTYPAAPKSPLTTAAMASGVPMPGS